MLSLKLSTTCLGILVCVFASACSGSGTFTDTIAEHSKTAILESKQLQNKAYPEARDLLGNSAVVFSVFATKSLPLESAEALHHAVIKKLNVNTFYTRLISDEELGKRLSQDYGQTQAKEIYLDSLTVVSVSDKDLSNPLGKYLQVDNFLVFQLDRWPCVGCVTDKGLRMKLRVVDAATSYIIWTGIAEKRRLTTDESANIDAVAIELAKELADVFNNRFKKKWHRKRVDNLFKSVS